MPTRQKRSVLDVRNQPDNHRRRRSERRFGYEDEAKIEASEVSRAVAAATLIAEGLDLPVDDASVLHNSNKLAVRLLPCDVFARARTCRA